MKLARLLLVVMLILVSAFSAQAILINEITIEDCAWNQSSAACYTSATVSCDLTSLLYTGDLSNLAMTRVVFTIDNIDYIATKTAGSTVNGTWSRSIELDADMNADIVLTGVAITEEEGSTCYADELTLSPPGCRWTPTDVTLDNTCDCTWTETEGVKLISNKREITRVPSVGCGPQVTTKSYYVWEDYCDPQWVPEYTPCEGAWTDGEMSFGLTTKSYYPANPSCCTATQTGAGMLDFNHNGGSDCTAPPDGVAPGNEFQCALGSWANYQDSLVFSGGDDTTRGMLYEDMTEYSGTVTVEQQPLVFDMDYDGYEEIILYDDVSQELRMYSRKMVLKSAIAIPLINWTVSQIALAGVNYNSIDGTYVLSDFVEEGGSPKIIVPGNDPYGNTAVLTYGVEAGNLVLDVPLIDSPAWAGVGEISGVACKVDKVPLLNDNTNCYFMTEDGYQRRYNIESGNDYVSTYQFPQYVSTSWFGITVDRVFMRSMVPLLFDDESGYARVVWWWLENSTWGSLHEQKIIYRGVLSDDVLLEKSSFSVRSPSGSVGGVTVDADKLQVWNPVATNWNGGTTIGQIVFTGGIPWTAGDDYMNMFVASLSLNYDNTDTTVIGKSLWYGVTEVGDCISNPVQTKCGVATDYVGLQYNVVNNNYNAAPDSNAPSLYSSHTMEQFENCTIRPADCVSGELTSALAIDGRYSFIVTTAPAGYLYDRVGDQMVYMASFALSHGGGVNQAFYDPQTKLLWVAALSTGADYAYYTVKVFDLTDPEVFFQVSNLQGNYGYPSTAYAMYGAFSPVDDYMSMGNYVFDRDDPTSGVIKTFDISVMSTGSHVVGYDESNDRLYMSTYSFAYEIIDNVLGFLDNDENMTGSHLNQYLQIYNFDSVVPKFITSATNDAKMVRETTPGSGTWIITPTGCGSGLVGEYFYPFYYKSDNYILGYTISSTNSLATKTVAVCDFSDQGNPVVTKYFILQDSVALRQGAVWMPDANTEDLSEDIRYLTVMTPSYLWNGNDQERLRTIAYDVGRSASVAASTYGKALCINPVNNALGRSVALPTAMACGPITRALVNADEYHDFLSVGGIVSPASYEVLSEFGTIARSFVPNLWTIPVSLNGDAVTDMLQTLPTVTIASISNIGLESVAIGDAELSTLNCIEREDSNVVTVQTVGKMPNPSATKIVLQYGGITHEYDRTEGPTFDLIFNQPGIYTITGWFVQTLPEVITSNKESCTVTVSQSATGLQVCSLGDDGEFNYDSTLAVHNWFGSSSSSQPVGGTVTLAPGLDAVYSVDGCIESFTTVTQSIKAKLGSRFEVHDSEGRVVAGYLFSTNGQLLTTNGVNIGEYSEGTWYEMSIELNPTTSLITTLQDGEVIWSTQGGAVVAGVKMIGDAEVDYVRVVGTGLPDGLGGTTGISGDSDGDGIVDAGEEVVVLEGDWTILSDCDSSIKDDPDMTVRTSYPVVAAYCNTVNGALCDYSDLQNVIRVNGDCTKEAMNYCVAVKYPSTLNNVGSDSAVIEGGVVCATNLGVGAAFSKIVVPTTGIFWTVFTSNWKALMIIALIFVMIALLMSGRRK